MRRLTRLSKAFIKIDLKKIYYIIFFFLLSANVVYSQCDGSVPVYYVDLSANPDSLWISDLIFKNGDCCSGNSDNCVQFVVTLSPEAEGVILDLYSGFYTDPNLEYQWDCGAYIPRGEPVCLDGVGPYTLNFCGDDYYINRYYIKSLPKPDLGVSITIAEGCQDTIIAMGFNPATTLWRSIYPGTLGEYNYLMDCTIGCEKVVVSYDDDLPDYIDFQVCGFALSLCETVGICDTVRVFFTDSLSTSISPEEPKVCFGNSTTIISANAIGGEPPYSYLWSTGETTESIEVGPGNYSVDVTDMGNCYVMSDQVTVTNLTEEYSVDVGPDLIHCFSIDSVSLDASVTNNAEGYWIGGEGIYFPDSTYKNALYVPSQYERYSGGAAMQFIISNSYNCPSDSDDVILSFQAFSGNISIDKQSPSCYNATDGFIELSMDNSSYSYSWEGSSNSSPYASNLAAGSYTVQISDSIQCDSILTIVLDEPDPIKIDSLHIIEPTCFNDQNASIESFISGGTGVYSYHYGSVAQDSLLNIIDSLSIGSYTIEVHDENMCSADTAVVIDQASALEANVDSIAHNLCFAASEGYIGVSASGGTGVLNYEWSTGQQGQVELFNLNAGIYTLVVNDENYCTDTLSIEIEESEELDYSIVSLEDVNCFNGEDGSLEIAVSGGTSPYFVQWGAQANNHIGTSLSGLSGGDYQASIIDSNLCSKNISIFIDTPLQGFDIEVEANSVLCFGDQNGEATVNVLGGDSGMYYYYWSDNAGIQIGETAYDLAIGNYEVVVANQNDCRDSIQFEIDGPEAIEVDIVANTMICFDSDSGFIQISPNGGTEPYSVDWLGLTSTNSNDTDLYFLGSGNYIFTLIDDNECVFSDTISIIESEQLILSSIEDQLVCENVELQIELEVLGGDADLSYFVNDSLSNQQITLQSTENQEYEVYASDSLNCISNVEVFNVNIIDINNESLSVYSDGTLCVGDSLTLAAVFSGTESDYMYEWNVGEVDDLGPFMILPEENAYYKISVTNECGQTLSDSIYIVLNEIPEILINSSVSQGCSPLNVSFENVFDDTGYSYQWDFGDENLNSTAFPENQFSDAGEYTVTVIVTASNACSNTQILNDFITVFPSPVSSFDPSANETDINNPTIYFINNSTNAEIYIWDFGDNSKSSEMSPEYTYTEPGSYTVTLVASNTHLCVDSSYTNINIKPNHDIGVPNAFTPNPTISNNGYYDPSALDNDVFYPFVSNVEQFTMKIFNRWGELLFESNDISRGWDGYYNDTKVKQGIYVYSISVVFKDGVKNAVDGKVMVVN
jgi:gliding motility-associated-like protein